MSKDKTSEKTNGHLKNDPRAKEAQKKFVDGKIGFREFLHELYIIQKEKIINGEL